MTLTIELRPELERRLAREAALRGQTVAELARVVLEERFGESAEQDWRRPEQHRDTVAHYSNLPRRSPADLEELARRQGASLAVDWAGLQPDFWPEDETPDEFLAAVREWRRDSTSWPDGVA